MKSTFDLKKVLELKEIKSELEFERALIADKKLRLLAKENDKYKAMRKQLRDLLQQYEAKNWSADSNITDTILKESDVAEEIAEKESVFIEKRKRIIQAQLKSFSLNQQEFGVLLGHESKSYISELMNGIRPFSLKDLIIIHRLLKIDLQNLIPTFLTQNERLQIKSSLEQLNKPNLKLSKVDFALG